MGGTNGWPPIRMIGIVHLWQDRGNMSGEPKVRNHPQALKDTVVLRDPEGPKQLPDGRCNDKWPQGSHRTARLLSETPRHPLLLFRTIVESREFSVRGWWPSSLCCVPFLEQNRGTERTQRRRRIIITRNTASQLGKRNVGLNTVDLN